MMSASEYTGEPSTWYDQGSASIMTATVKRSQHGPCALP